MLVLLSLIYGMYALLEPGPKHHIHLYSICSTIPGISGMEHACLAQMHSSSKHTARHILNHITTMVLKITTMTVRCNTVSEM